MPENETPPGQAGLANTSLLGGFDNSESTKSPAVAQAEKRGGLNADLDRMEESRKEIERLRAAHPADFRDGVAVGLGKPPPGTRDPGDYPSGFHGWPSSNRNAWFAGFNFGFCRRPRDDE
jgi:hypothetical protein